MSRQTAYVLDSSAIVALILNEPGSEDLDESLNAAVSLLVGTPTLVETAMVLISRLGAAEGMTSLLSFLHLTNCDTVDFTALHFAEAAGAFERYGKGRHSARLNMGDCNSYAIAKVAGVPLLYKGNDFALTDLPVLTLPEG